MAEMVPVTITGVVRGTEEGPGRRERFFIELGPVVNGTVVNGTAVNGTAVNGTAVNGTAADGDDRRLQIGVGDAEAHALAFSLQGMEFPRPMTYQLMASLVTAAGSAVRSVRVAGRRDDIFYAQVMLRGGTTVDARPSDALNLAAITGAPIYVDSALLDLPTGSHQPIV